MPRGKQPNINRDQARDLGEKTYVDSSRPCWCGCNTRYVVNAQCVDCMIAKGKARYAKMGEAALADLKARDHARYIARLAAGKPPRI